MILYMEEGNNEEFVSSWRRPKKSWWEHSLNFWLVVNGYRWLILQPLDTVMWYRIWRSPVHTGKAASPDYARTGSDFMPTGSLPPVFTLHLYLHHHPLILLLLSLYSSITERKLGIRHPSFKNNRVMGLLKRSKLTLPRCWQMPSINPVTHSSTLPGDVLPSCGIKRHYNTIRQLLAEQSQKSAKLVEPEPVRRV